MSVLHWSQIRGQLLNLAGVFVHIDYDEPASAVITERRTCHQNYGAHMPVSKYISTNHVKKS